VAMRVQLQPCFVLHRREYRNSSLILEVFSAEYGRVGLVARGVRSARSQSNALLQAFQPLLISWSGRGDLYTLTHVEAAEFVPPLSGHSYASAYYLTELIMRLLQRMDAHTELFTLYANAIACLRIDGGDKLAAERNLRLFEKHLLEELGYGLVLDHDVNSGEVLQPEQEYCYVPEHGPVLKTPAALQNGPIVHGSSLIALANGELGDGNSLRDCKRLMRTILQGYIGDKPLQSRMLYTSNHVPK